MITETIPTSTIPTPAKAGNYRHLFAPNQSYKLLLAIDNDDNAPAAIRITAALQHRGAEPQVIRTLELMAPVAGGNAADTVMVYSQAVLGAEFYEDQERIIRNTISDVLGTAPPWPVKTLVGDPSSTILYDAEMDGAELVVMGIHHHGVFAQALGENTATRVMSRAPMPVLGIRPDTEQLPRRVMVATDFGNASWEAAHLAANIADPGGVVVLVHVALPSPVVEEGDEGAALVEREGIAQAFLRLSDEIKVGKSIRVETVTRTGDAAKELLAAADQINPDLVAAASQRHGLLTRIVLGSVSRTLVRDGRWSTLIAPPAQGR